MNDELPLWLGLALLVVFLLLPASAKADPWDTGDKTLGFIAAALVITDWGQTRYVAKHPEAFMEKNAILGDHPRVGQVDRYFVTLLVGGYLFADWLSSHNRKGFLAGISIVELKVTQHNKSIGVKVDF